MTDEELRADLVEALDEFRPLSAEFGRTVRRYADAVRANDAYYIDLAEQFARGGDVSRYVTHIEEAEVTWQAALDASRRMYEVLEGYGSARQRTQDALMLYAQRMVYRKVQSQGETDATKMLAEALHGSVFGWSE